MTYLRIAAVQATYVLMDRDATIDRVAELTAAAAGQGAQFVVFPEAFVPGTPIWIDTRPIWDGDDDWFVMLAENAVSIPSPATDRLAAIASKHSVWLVVGVAGAGTAWIDDLQHGPVLLPRGRLVDRHRKLVPTGSERTVWGMGDGSTLRVVDTEHARIGGLICWENYMPLARFHLYAQGVDVWLAPTLAQGDDGSRTMRHLARENRMYVVGVNPVLHVDQIPTDFPGRERLVPATYVDENGPWIEPGNTVIVEPSGALLAARCESARRRSSRISTWPRWRLPAASWTRPVTTIALTSSGSWSTRRADKQPHQRKYPCQSTARTRSKTVDCMALSSVRMSSGADRRRLDAPLGASAAPSHGPCLRTRGWSDRGSRGSCRGCTRTWSNAKTTAATAAGAGPTRGGRRPRRNLGDRLGHTSMPLPRRSVRHNRSAPVPIALRHARSPSSRSRSTLVSDPSAALGSTSTSAPVHQARTRARRLSNCGFGGDIA